jgi:hypothetical protein
MKVNKIILKICHFFNYRLDEEHQDDITINIPTVYPEEEFDDFIYNHETSFILDDIFDQIYKRFEKDSIIEKRCSNIRAVFVTFYENNNHNGGSRLIRIPYLDGVLYNPYDPLDNQSFMRQIKLNKLLDEKYK